mgnify:CR=1 FL=1
MKFDKRELGNLEYALDREMLATDRRGGYMATTIVGCNTRKYHGLMVAPIDRSDRTYVLLSSLDETVVQHDQSFNLALHRFEGTYEPRGHKYITDFEYTPTPTITYRVGGVILKKELLWIHNRTQLMIRYTLVDAHSDTTLRLRPLLAFRDKHSLSKANMDADGRAYPIPYGVKCRLYDGFPWLNMQLSKEESEFVAAPDWYYNFEYRKELARGYEGHEDLLTPGYFEFNIKKGESVVFSAGLSEIDTKTLAELAEFEVNIRTPRDNFYNTLVNSAHQFIVHREHEDYVLAGYPWFKCRARDQFISLPGLTLTNNELTKYDDVMETAEKAIRAFMDGEEIKVSIQEMDQPDVLLWAVWCIQQYGKFESMDTCVQKYYALVRDIMTWILGNNHPNLKVMDNKLVYSEGRDKAITWMNSTANGRPIVPRTGYIVEFNALWYNALKFAIDLCTHTGDAKNVKMFSELAEEVGKSFVGMFWNEHGYLCDYCVDGYRDYLVRPNMIFAVAFDYTPLDKKQQKSVLDFCTKELLTPKGLRSLSPKSSGYNPMYVGPQVQRDYAYHQGTAWPWLAGFYMEACLKVHKMSRASFVDRLLVGYEEELFYHCIATIPELFDGNPPFHGRGAISFAMNVAEIMRVVKLLDQYNEY